MTHSSLAWPGREQQRAQQEIALVSPYLLRPLRSLEQALAERHETALLEECGDDNLQRELDDLRALLDREFPLAKERAA